MKALITGVNGQLGRALSLKFPDAILADSKTLDIRDADAVQNFDASRIEAIINAAAYTKVDAAEDPANLSLVWQVNSEGPANLATLAAKLKVPLVHISTDYVFDGTSSQQYSEDDLANPISVYGASKAAGDLAVATWQQHYIFRTSWVIGEGNNFVRIMQNLAAKGVDPKVVNDQFGRLTFCDTLAAGILFALKEGVPFGTYNLTNSGDVASWFEIAQNVFKLSKTDPGRVSPISTEEYYADKSEGSVAPRPKNSALSLTKIEDAGFHPEDWRAKLEEYLRLYAQINR